MTAKAEIYKEIEREYEAIRSRKAAELRYRKEIAEQTVPRLGDITRELSLLGVQTAKLVLQKPEDVKEIAAILERKQKGLMQERERLLEQAGIQPHFLEPEYECTACQDTGYVGNERCLCFKRKIMDKMYDQSNVRDIVRQENFDSFDLRLYSDKADAKEGISPRENAQKILRRALAYTKNFDAGGENLILYGSTGLGKTFVCNCIAKELLDSGKMVLYLSAGQLFRKLEELRFSKEDENEREDWDRELLDADLLIIDDLGTEFSTLFTATELFRIINDRKLLEKSVVISTNLSPEEMTNLYSDRITSRFREYGSIKFFGEDIRVVKKRK